MSVFDEIKQKMHEAIDKAVDALHGSHDLEEARPIAQATTQVLKAQALQVEAQLMKRVADNAATAKESETVPVEQHVGTGTVSNEHVATAATPAPIVEREPGEEPALLEPAHSAPEGSTQIGQATA